MTGGVTCVPEPDKANFVSAGTVDRACSGGEPVKLDLEAGHTEHSNPLPPVNFAALLIFGIKIRNIYLEHCIKQACCLSRHASSTAVHHCSSSTSSGPGASYTSALCRQLCHVKLCSSNSSNIGCYNG